MRGVLAITAFVSTLSWCGFDGSARAADAGWTGMRPPIQGASADDATRRAAAEALGATTCKQQVLRELEAGRRGGAGCDDARRELSRPLIRRARRRFGFVERRDVQLAKVHLVLGEARRCRSWPLRDEGRGVLDPRDIDAAACRKTRYEGPVAVTLVAADERRVTLPPLFTDEDGEVDVEIARLDAIARGSGHGGLERWVRIELGRDGWAGVVDLRRLRQFRADWHHQWVAAGRGAAGLFAVAHPDHPAAADDRAAAVEARLERQRADVEAVVAGKLSALEFLERHAWSPYRRALEDYVAGRITRAQLRGAAGSRSAPRRTPK